MKYFLSLIVGLCLVTCVIAHPHNPRPIIRPIVIRPIVPPPIIIRPIIVRPIVQQPYVNHLYWRQVAIQNQIWYQQELERTRFINQIAERNNHLQNITNKYNTIYNELYNSNDFVLVQALNHQDPMYRLISVRVIGEMNRINLAANLLDKLADPYPDVQQSARFSLVHFFNVDFGPLPGSDINQISFSISKWREITR